MDDEKFLQEYERKMAELTGQMEETIEEIAQERDKISDTSKQ